MIHADFETRSAIDLLKVGTYKYASHSTTDVNCLGWAIGDDEVHLWYRGDPVPKLLINQLKSGAKIAAWNAQFERLIWNNVLTRYGFPPLPLERFYCIAALSRARGGPGKLEKAAHFYGLSTQKDMAGHYLMLKLCKPRHVGEDGTIVWWDDDGDLKRLGTYCKQDVRVERAMRDLLVPFSSQELSDYHLSEEINDRGVCVDTELAKIVVSSLDKEKLTTDDILTMLTDNRVTAHTQVQRIMEWVEEEWKPLPNLNKTTISDALIDEDIPPHVAQVLELRTDNARAAVSKFAAILARHTEGTVRGLFIYRGAGQTGRFTSMGLQIHNLVRESMPEAIPIVKRHGLSGVKMLGNPVQILAKMVRPAFIASPGKTFLIGDFAQIEARITAWLAGEEKLLRLFRDNEDVYCAFGKIAYKRIITKADIVERFVSKGCVLGLGFGGAEGALARTLKTQGNIVLPHDELGGFVRSYRTAYTRIVALWYVLRDAVLMAMYSRGTIIPVGPISYLFDGEHLWCRLPSGRLMCYPYAKIVTDDYGDSVEYRRGNRSPKAGVSEWPVVNLWYGMLTENLAQAIAFDLLMGALRRLRKWAVRIHVHDEIVVEVDEKEAEDLLPKFLSTMIELPEWADGLPVGVEGKASKVYVK